MENREWLLTGLVLGIGTILVGVAVATSPSPPSADMFAEEGEPLFPEFTDPTLATSIEITTFDEETASGSPFKVELRNGTWRIPSHENYPAEAEKRLVDTATRITELRKDSVRSDRADDHEKLGVLDPLSDSLTATRGIGTRVTLHDETQRVLADFIIGKEVEGRDGTRFARLAGKNRTYAVKMDVEPSTDFHDWIEPDLLKIDQSDIRRVDIDDYRIDEQFGTRISENLLFLSKEEGGDWSLKGMKEWQRIVRDKLDDLMGALDDLKIVDVRRKPPGITEGLRTEAGIQLTRTDLDQLQIMGYFLGRDGGLYSNEGEIRVWSKLGVLYILRFGELVRGTDVSEERRYLFVTTQYDEGFIPEPEDESKKEEWAKQVEEGKKKSKELTDRFAEWYYIIPGDEFSKTRLELDTLIEPNPDLFDWKAGDVVSVKIRTPALITELSKDTLGEAGRNLANLRADSFKLLAEVKDVQLAGRSTYIIVTLPEEKTIRITVGGSPPDNADLRYCAFSDRPPVALVRTSDIEAILNAKPEKN